MLLFICITRTKESKHGTSRQINWHKYQVDLGNSDCGNEVVEVVELYYFQQKWNPKEFQLK